MLLRKSKCIWKHKSPVGILLSIVELSGCCKVPRILEIVEAKVLFFDVFHEIFTVVYSTHFYEFQNSLGILNTTKNIKKALFYGCYYENEEKIFPISMLYCIAKKSKNVKKVVFTFTIGMQNAYIHRKFPTSCLQIALANPVNPFVRCQYFNFCYLLLFFFEKKYEKMKKLKTEKK